MKYGEPEFSGLVMSGNFSDSSARNAQPCSSLPYYFFALEVLRKFENDLLWFRWWWCKYNKKTLFGYLISQTNNHSQATIIYHFPAHGKIKKSASKSLLKQDFFNAFSTLWPPNFFHPQKSGINCFFYKKE